jgi:hypothetical protein
MELRVLSASIDRTVGSILDPTLERVRWLASLPAFRSVLVDAPARLDRELVMLRRFAASRTNVARLRESLDYARRRECEVARSVDGPLIDEALALSKSYWNWNTEYFERVEIISRGSPSTCPYCDQFATEADARDQGNREIQRRITTCGYCGIVEDVPRCDLRVRLLRETLVGHNEELTGVVAIANDGDREHWVRVGVAIARAGEMRPESTSKAEVRVGPRASGSFAFRLLSVIAPSELMQVRVYFSVEAAFGVLSTYRLFGGSRIAPGETSGFRSDV